MREGKDKNIEFVVNIKNKDQHLWPSHLSAVYISDRISDIKKERKTEDVNVVITVPSSCLFHCRSLAISTKSKSWIS